MSLLLKNGVVVNSKGKRRVDVRIDGEKIVEVGADLPKQHSIVENVEGCYLFPGFIDAHTHMQLNNGPGSIGTVDDFHSGTAAAVANGTTTIIDMATPTKGDTLLECQRIWDRFADGHSSCDYCYHMAVIEWTPETPKQIKEVIDAGTTSFKLYFAYPNLRLQDSEIFSVMKELKKYGAMVGAHCENGEIVDDLIKQFVEAGKLAPHFHPLSRPNVVEAEAVNRYLMIARLADLPVNIVHLSTRQSLEIVRRARAEGQKVYVETCPQYLLLDESLYDLPEFESAKFVCSPPLRSLADQNELWQAIADGEVNTISTDHCSFDFDGQKTLGKCDFSKIPNGMPGVETRPQLIYTYGVEEKRISVEKMIALLSEDIAKQFHLYPRKGVIQQGSDADIVVWDPTRTGVISDQAQLQKSDYSPYDGFQYVGKAQSVYLRGEKVAENGKVVKEDSGTYISRKIGIN